MTLTARLALLCGAGVVAVGVMAWSSGLGWDEITHLGQPRNVVEVAGVDVRVPASNSDGERLAAQIPVSTSGEHSFLFEDNGEPVRLDPCRPVSWVLNPEGMPAGAEDLIHAATADVGTYSGLDFAYEGETDEVAAFDRAIVQARYGDRLAPVVIGWSDATATPDLEGSTAGLGGSTSITGAFGDQRFLAAGVVVLDGEDFTDLLDSTAGTALAEAVIRHELAHVLGLGHVAEPTELMHGENTAITTWGPGDREGLAIAGAGPCED
ncbi:hypothetical protein [Demequina litorisediminis]|uniref:Matrixin n=1 Tax=Demequina litorisediminis TaxID=1849022 RepID=A0ABQ6IJ64_9MICO|nr:hypothetical protein [Demequina litorisediminis]GMA37141.1 hypothetical protein GCM10025876_33450 [Demequina litorisediminis]